MPHLFGWALLLGERELVRAVARQVLTAFRATGILEIGAFVTLWVLGDETYLDDPAMQHVFQQTGLAAYWDIFGPPEFARRNVASA